MLNVTKFLEEYILANDSEKQVNCFGTINYDEGKGTSLQIRFECEGGYANIRLRYHADVNNLHPDLKQNVLALIEQSRLFELRQPASETKGHGPPDVVHYKLILEDGQKRQALECNDVTAAPSVRPLLSLLRQLALEQAGK